MPLNYDILALYVVTVITAIAVPGPLALLIAGAGLQGGPRKALHTTFGTNSASLILILLSSLIMKGLFAFNEIAFDLLKTAGACYIAYIGWGMLREGGIQDTTDRVVKPHVGGFFKGFVMAISNPLDIVFFASFFPQFMGITQSTNTSLTILAIVWIVLDFSILMLTYILLSTLLKPNVHQAMLRISGAFLMLVAAGGIAITAVSLLHSNVFNAR
jgi:threonine/homoserine/homoserine lactone efflux protein